MVIFKTLEMLTFFERPDDSDAPYYIPSGEIIQAEWSCLFNTRGEFVRFDHGGVSRQVHIPTLLNLKMIRVFSPLELLAMEAK